ncbi:MAG TPA: hypothetical protein VFA48_12160 [Gammaproteobacteria bacterium]|nr:hypothetical protein [Gammaproteobacteria bacterium]
MLGLPSCRDVSYELSREYMQGASARRSWRVRAHLLICGACRRYEQYLAWMRDNVRRAADNAASARLSHAQRERIRQTLHEQLD